MPRPHSSGRHGARYVSPADRGAEGESFVEHFRRKWGLRDRMTPDEAAAVLRELHEDPDWGDQPDYGRGAA